MKLTLLILLSLLCAGSMSAQLAIAPGAQFSIAGNMQVTLRNTDLINNGGFTAGNSTVRFTGNTATSISGNQVIQFHELEVNKENNAELILQRPIGITQRILFSTGFLNLNGFDATLAASARLDGEQENSRITGTNGGQVLVNAILNAPLANNPGNLGVFITSAKNLGAVTIKRGQQGQNGIGLNNSILRYYDIIPSNNTDLNATLRFNYFDTELNGLNENSLLLFKSDDAITWLNQGFTSRNTITDFVEKTGISSLSRWTLSNFDNPLPVRFVSFTTKCEGSGMLITWKTAQEQNTNHFDIEKSADGILWTVIANLPAAGNSTRENIYSFTDTRPVQNENYRIAEYDLDGKITYSNILRSFCNVKDIFSSWPNPVNDVVFFSIIADRRSQALVKVFDSKGTLVKTQEASVLQGSNKLSVQIGSLMNGIYSITVEWNNGQMKKVVQVLKQ